MEAPEKLKAVKGLMKELRHDMTEKMLADNILSYNVKWHEKGNYKLECSETLLSQTLNKADSWIKQ